MHSRPCPRAHCLRLAALCWLALLASALPTAADARHAGEPRSWSLPAKHSAAVPLVELPGIDPAALLAEDQAGAEVAKGGGALRFAVPRALRLDTRGGGRWTSLADGARLWQLRVRVPRATDLNLALSRVALPGGATLHVFSTRERYYDGPYTAADIRPHGRFWSPVVPGDEAILELYLPAGAGTAEVVLAEVNAGYRDLFGRAGGPVLKAGACNVDVACPLGDLYRDEIRSVARYTINGSGLCTGTLVMDAARSFRPWFLTAAHCGVSSEAVADSLVVYWNFEQSSCGGTGGGSLADNQAGAAFRARREDVDMGLVELDAMPDPAFDVHYAGWDRSGAAPVGSIHIHHPNGDEKAISFNDDPLTTSDSCIINGTTDTHWHINDYEQGTTEPGSSGSGLWTQAPTARLIGFLSGGTASCSDPDGFDCYGKFDVAWDGPAASQRLSDWLGSGLPAPPQQVDGSDPIGFTLALAPETIAVCRGDTVDVEVQLQANGGFSEPVALSLAGLPTGVGGSFDANPVMPPGSSLLELSAGGAVPVGDYLVQVQGTAASASGSTPLPLRVDSSAPGVPTVVFPLLGSGPVDLFPTFTWTGVAGATAYRIEVAAEGNFAAPHLDAVVQGTSHTAVLALAPATAYMWRVRALNGCGEGSPSAALFTTGTAWCRAEDADIPDGSSAGISRTVQIAGAGTLLDLDLGVDIEHGYVGDLSVMLRHEGSGVELVLVDRPGVPASTYGCSGDDVAVVLDDEAAAAVETRCTGSPAISGSLRPNQPLSAFDGLSFDGQWTLTVSDAVGEDAGTLQRWCLVPQLALPAAIFRDGFEP